MKIKLLVLAICVVAFVSCKNTSKTKSELDINSLSAEITKGYSMDTLSYTHGIATARTLKGQKLTTLNIDNFANTIEEFFKQPDSVKSQDIAQKEVQEMMRKNNGFENLNDSDRVKFEKNAAVLFFDGFIRVPEFTNINIQEYKRGLKNAWEKDEIDSETELRESYLKFKKNYNKDLGAKYLEKNKLRDGIKVTASGLQYEVIKAATTDTTKPEASNEVTVHYEGTLINGKVFDSSYKRGETISFGLNRVIKGWTEGLQLMSPGSKYRFYIPYDLAYGERGNQGIPPFSALIFDVELFSFK